MIDGDDEIVKEVINSIVNRVEMLQRNHNLNLVDIAQNNDILHCDKENKHLYLKLSPKSTLTQVEEESLQELNRISIENDVILIEQDQFEEKSFELVTLGSPKSSTSVVENGSQFGMIDGDDEIVKEVINSIVNRVEMLQRKLDLNLVDTAKNNEPISQIKEEPLKEMNEIPDEEQLYAPVLESKDNLNLMGISESNECGKEGEHFDIKHCPKASLSWVKEEPLQEMILTPIVEIPNAPVLQSRDALNLMDIAENNETSLSLVEEEPFHEINRTPTDEILIVPMLESKDNLNLMDTTENNTMCDKEDEQLPQVGITTEEIRFTEMQQCKDDVKIDLDEFVLLLHNEEPTHFDMNHSSKLSVSQAGENQLKETKLHGFVSHPEQLDSQLQLSRDNHHNSIATEETLHECDVEYINKFTIDTPELSFSQLSLLEEKLMEDSRPGIISFKNDLQLSSDNHQNSMTLNNCEGTLRECDEEFINKLTIDTPELSFSQLSQVGENLIQGDCDSRPEHPLTSLKNDLQLSSDNHQNSMALKSCERTLRECEEFINKVELVTMDPPELSQVKVNLQEYDIDGFISRPEHPLLILKKDLQLTYNNSQNSMNTIEKSEQEYEKHLELVAMNSPELSLPKAEVKYEITPFCLEEQDQNSKLDGSVSFDDCSEKLLAQEVISFCLDGNFNSNTNEPISDLNPTWQNHAAKEYCSDLCAVASDCKLLVHSTPSADSQLMGTLSPISNSQFALLMECLDEESDVSMETDQIVPVSSIPHETLEEDFHPTAETPESSQTRLFLDSIMPEGLDENLVPENFVEYCEPIQLVLPDLPPEASAIFENVNSNFVQYDKLPSFQSTFANDFHPTAETPESSQTRLFLDSIMPEGLDENLVPENFVEYCEPIQLVLPDLPPEASAIFENVNSNLVQYDKLPSFQSTFANALQCVYDIDDYFFVDKQFEIHSNEKTPEVSDFSDSEKVILTIGELTPLVSPIPEDIEKSFYWSPTVRYLEVEPFLPYLDNDKINKAEDRELEFLMEVSKCKEISAAICAEHRKLQEMGRRPADPLWIRNFVENEKRLLTEGKYQAGRISPTFQKWMTYYSSDSSDSCGSRRTLKKRKTRSSNVKKTKTTRTRNVRRKNPLETKASSSTAVMGLVNKTDLSITPNKVESSELSSSQANLEVVQDLPKNETSSVKQTVVSKETLPENETNNIKESVDIKETLPTSKPEETTKFKPPKSFVVPRKCASKLPHCTQSSLKPTQTNAKSALNVSSGVSRTSARPPKFKVPRKNNVGQELKLITPGTGVKTETASKILTSSSVENNSGFIVPSIVPTFIPQLLTRPPQPVPTAQPITVAPSSSMDNVASNSSQSSALSYSSSNLATLQTQQKGPIPSTVERKASTSSASCIPQMVTKSTQPASTVQPPASSSTDNAANSSQSSALSNSSSNLATLRTQRKSRKRPNTGTSQSPAPKLALRNVVPFDQKRSRMYPKKQNIHAAVTKAVESNLKRITNQNIVSWIRFFTLLNQLPCCEDFFTSVDDFELFGELLRILLPSVSSLVHKEARNCVSVWYQYFSRSKILNLPGRIVRNYKLMRFLLTELKTSDVTKLWQYLKVELVEKKFKSKSFGVNAVIDVLKKLTPASNKVLNLEWSSSDSTQSRVLKMLGDMLQVRDMLHEFDFDLEYAEDCEDGGNHSGTDLPSRGVKQLSENVAVAEMIPPGEKDAAVAESKKQLVLAQQEALLLDLNALLRGALIPQEPSPEDVVAICQSFQMVSLRPEFLLRNTSLITSVFIIKENKNPVLRDIGTNLWNEFCHVLELDHTDNLTKIIARLTVKILVFNLEYFNINMENSP